MNKYSPWYIDLKEPIPVVKVRVIKPKKTPKPIRVYAVVRSEGDGIKNKDIRQVPEKRNTRKKAPKLASPLPDGVAKPLGENSSIMVRGSRVTLKLDVADFDSPFRWALDNFLQRKSGNAYRLPDGI